MIVPVAISAKVQMALVKTYASKDKTAPGPATAASAAQSVKTIPVCLLNKAIELVWKTWATTAQAVVDKTAPRFGIQAMIAPAIKGALTVVAMGTPASTASARPTRKGSVNPVLV